MIPGAISRCTETTVASATTIDCKSDLIKITGSTTIQTINPPFGGQFSLVIVIYPVDGAVTLGNSGNILVGIAMAQNRSVWLAWSKSLQKWLINSGV